MNSSSYKNVDLAGLDKALQKADHYFFGDNIPPHLMVYDDEAADDEDEPAILMKVSLLSSAVSQSCLYSVSYYLQLFSLGILVCLVPVFILISSDLPVLFPHVSINILDPYLFTY